VTVERVDGKGAVGAHVANVLAVARNQFVTGTQILFRLQLVSNSIKNWFTIAVRNPETR